MKGANAISLEMNEKLLVKRVKSKNTTIEDLTKADGYIFCCPENLASVSGEMLEFFHRSYYQIFDITGSPEQKNYEEVSSILGKPYAVAISAGTDGSSAASQITRICKGWRLFPVTEHPLIIRNGLVQSKGNILGEKELSLEGGKSCEGLGGLAAANILLKS